MLCQGHIHPKMACCSPQFSHANELSACIPSTFRAKHAALISLCIYMLRWRHKAFLFLVRFRNLHLYDLNQTNETVFPAAPTKKLNIYNPDEDYVFFSRRTNNKGIAIKYLHRVCRKLRIHHWHSALLHSNFMAFKCKSTQLKDSFKRKLETDAHVLFY